MNFPPDYYERVYAGVLGKIIGVYLGRPIEGWPYEEIMTQFGEIKYYVNDRRFGPLGNHDVVVADDDISGTFTFLRALPDYGNSPNLTPAQIGQTWLNYIIENRTILWWGGMGNSTEHTAFLRLKSGIPAPQSGSMALNGKVVSEQIGAQIFIDGWGMVAPGDPALAADLARRAGSVSHDGEAIYGAQVVAALIAQAFVETDLNKMLATAVSYIPQDSVVFRMIADLRAWHIADPHDWHAARSRLAERYGYDQYGGGCHIIPNHGLVILSLLYSRGDFSLAQTIVNTCGWDTDCNAANVGSIMGVWRGLAAFACGPDWRGPVADRLYLPTADGGRAISDALLEADAIMEAAYGLQGQVWTKPKSGARFHFSLPGSVQGFRASGSLSVENNPARRALALRYNLRSGESAAALTPTFVLPDGMNTPGYSLLAAPTLYPGQTVHALVTADAANAGPVAAALQLQHYGTGDKLIDRFGPAQTLLPGESKPLTWQVPGLAGYPTAQIGVVVAAPGSAAGVLYLDYLTWDGSPEMRYFRPSGEGHTWKHQWVNAVDDFGEETPGLFRLTQNRGRGMIITGTRQWVDYAVQVILTPHLVRACGLAVRVQGLERYYALLLSERSLIKLVRRLDGEVVLAEIPLAWEFGKSYALRLAANSSCISAWLDGTLLFTVDDPQTPLSGGGMALVCDEGRLSAEQIIIQRL